MELSPAVSSIDTDFEKILTQPENQKLMRGVVGQFFAPGEEQQDLHQEAMIGLWQATKDFDPDREASFKTFATRCVTSNVLNHVRAATRLKHQPLNYSLDITSPPLGDEGLALADILPDTYRSSPEKIVLYKEWLLDSSEALGGLSDTDREVHKLCDIQGLNFLEASAVTSVNPRKINECLRRARRQLISRAGSPFIED